MCVSFVNYAIDPANIYHSAVVDDMVNALSAGKIIIISNGDVDEGRFKKEMIPAISFDPKTVVIGSSHIMYIDWDKLYPETLNAGMSGSYLGDYYAIVGLLKESDIHPERIVIGVDAWAFTRDVSGLRHTALSSYSNYAEQLVEGKNVSFSDYKESGIDPKKIKELFSFSYFQSSVNNLQNNGVQYYLESKVKECDDDSPDPEANKVTPSMRYIMSLRTYGTVEENDMAARGQVDPPNIYQIGGQYSELDKGIYNEFVELVDYLLAEGIEVSFYLPSYYPTMYDLFAENESFKGVLEVEDITRSVAKERGIEVHGTYNPYEAGVTKEDFADVLHMKPDIMLENYNYQRK